MPELLFKGKEFVYNYHLTVPFRPLVPDLGKSIGAGRLDNNLVVHGDNLAGLKTLLPMFAGKIDVIYIDPPYNTGNEGWCYNDNVSSPMLREWLDSNPVSIDDRLRHDKWLCMMWPRLALLRDLLHEDGLLFISINEIEASRLRAIVVELFGEQRVIGEFVWKSRQNKDNRNISGLSEDHEFILIIGKQLAGEERIAEAFDNPDDDPRGPWASGNMVGLASPEARPNLHYDLVNPADNTNYGCPPRGWRYEKATMDGLIAEKRVLWPASPSGRPREKVFVREMTPRTNVSSVIALPIFTRDGTDAYEQIFGNRDFPFPKPPELIQFLITQHPNPNALVLDNFAGSGTTAQAVLEANQADGGNRRFIMIEFEDYADRITAERARRVIQGYDYKGTQRHELLREPLTFNKFRNSARLMEQIGYIEARDATRFDRFTRSVDGGSLVLAGERTANESVPGTGGEFTFCALGPPLELDRILTGDTLPSFEALASVLYHAATNEAFDLSKATVEDHLGYLGSVNSFHVWLIYEPDLNFLKSREAALTLSKAKHIVEKDPRKAHLVFAPSKFVSRKVLEQHSLPVQYAPLPFALYRVERS